MKLHNPLPEPLEVQCGKAASILEHFVKGTTKLDATFIPSKVLEKARGVAIITVVKAGFLWSGRAGSGLVVARLDDGSWSAPSAILAAGAGVGAQLGAEITDFVFVLNNAAAVRAFSHGGNFTLGGSMSVAAGPTGRTTEAAGALVNLAPIYSYSKSKGIFAGISLEGTLIVTRADANRRMYGKHVSARDLLSGKIPPPVEAEPLYRMLGISRFARVGTRGPASAGGGGEEGASTCRPDAKTARAGADVRASESTLQGDTMSSADADAAATAAAAAAAKRQTLMARISAASTLKRNTAQTPASSLAHPPTAPSVLPRHATRATASSSSSAAAAALPPPPPLKPKPQGLLRKAVALFDFDGERPTDLSFKAGDVIWISRQTDSQEDWWTGKRGTVEGDFPANYVRVE